MKGWLFVGLGVGIYVAVAFVMALALSHYGMERPIIGGILWPLRIVKLLLGGG